jgi:cell division protein FtsB
MTEFNLREKLAGVLGNVETLGPDPQLVQAVSDCLDGIDQQQAEIERLRARVAELEAEESGLQDLVIRQGKHLSRIVNTIRGEPPLGHLHSTHNVSDLVDERIAALEAENRALRERNTEGLERVAKTIDEVDQRNADRRERLTGGGRVGHRQGEGGE